MTRHRRMMAAIACAGALAMLAAPPCPAQTGAATNPRPLARYVPGSDLFFYAEFDGLAAHDAAWKKTALDKVLDETKLGAMLDDLVGQAVAQALAADRDAEKPTPEELIGMFRAVLRDGVAFGLAGNPRDEKGVVGVLVLRNGARNTVHDYIARIQAKAGKEKAGVRRGSRTIFSEGPGSANWWYEGDDLVVAMAGSQVDAVLAVVDGKAPNATTSTIRTELTKPESGLEPVAVAFLDFAKIPMPPDAARFGLDGLKRIDYRAGFEGEALNSRVRVLAPAPRRGLLALLDGPTFGKTTLPPIPAGLTSWTVFSLSPATFYDRVRGLMALGNPQGTRGLDAFEQGVQQNLGIRLKEDVLARLGPRWVFYLNGEAPPAGQQAGKIRAALLADVREPAAFATTLDKVMGVVSQVMKAQARQNPRSRLPEVRKVEGETPGYRLVFPEGMIPPQAAAFLDPTMLVGKKQFAIALTGAEARVAVSGEKPWTPGPDFAAAFDRLPGNLIALSVDDPRATIPPLVANAPALVAGLNTMMAAQAAGKPGAPQLQLRLDPSKVPTADEVGRRLFPNTTAVSLDREGLTISSRDSVPSVTGAGGVAFGTALLLPAVQAAREAARRTQCVNNEKQIGLALHNYHSTNNAFPAAAITGKDGKPLLSWRVAILPFLNEQELYNAFHLDEPWDSPNNKPLIARMPNVYQCPSRPRGEPGTTTYKVFVGGGALFDREKRVGIQQVLDGTANTLAVVEGKTPVIWTKPDDIAFDPKAAAGLLDAGSNHAGGFNALFADGSVRFLKNSVAAQVFRALITRAGGEVIDAGAY